MTHPFNLVRRRQQIAEQLRTAVEVASASPVAGGGTRSAEGDEERLRAIPAIAKGVAGEVPGTRPDRAVG
jgi:hypothetical protein